MDRRTKFRINMGALGIVVLCLSGWFAFGTHTVQRDSAQLQAMLDKHLPKTKYGITAEQATVNLADNKATFTIEITGRKLGKDFRLVAEGVGAPDYKNSRHGDFYFLPESVEVLEFDWSGSTPTKMVERATKYTPKRFQEYMGRKALRVEDWIRESAQKGAILALEKLPVYRLKEDTAIGTFMHAALINHGTQIQGDKLVIQFSFWKISLMVIIGVVIVLLLIGLIIMAPEALLFFAWV